MRRLAIGAAAATLAFAPAAGLLLGRRPPLAAAVCPAALRADAARASRVRVLLASTAEGRDVLRRVGGHTPRVCFGGDEAGVLRADGVLVLSPQCSEREQAARLGHLLLHAVEGPPFPVRPAPSRPCADLVAAAVRAEARAHALELRLRRELGVTAPRLPFPFEGAFWAAPAERQVEVVRTWLLAPPAGAGGPAGLAAAYARRCAEVRASTPATSRSLRR
ncbi:MAG: hypothetical protein HY744_22900 [Deltaproteobacteria bacterium]|nr:hypothetical protein [Deltaproteobacteria bacterium]